MIISDDKAIGRYNESRARCRHKLLLPLPSPLPPPSPPVRRTVGAPLTRAAIRLLHLDMYHRLCHLPNYPGDRPGIAVEQLRIPSRGIIDKRIVVHTREKQKADQSFLPVRMAQSFGPRHWRGSRSHPSLCSGIQKSLLLPA